VSRKFVFALVALIVFTSGCETTVNTPIPTALPPLPALAATNTPRPFTPTPELDLTATVLALPTNSPNCKNLATFLEDVTVEDNANFKAGETFTKIWRFRNDGSCTWTSQYHLVFDSGDQMGSPVSTPLDLTPPGSELDVSVDMVAPATDGAYTAVFKLQDPDGETFPIGAIESVWVKITVGAGSPSTAVPAPIATTDTSGTSNVQPTTVASTTCQYSQNAAYVNSILTSINTARSQNGLSTLTINNQLTAAAQGHAVDMACNSLLSHSGSDGSTVWSRVAAQGYAASYVVENIYAGGSAQDAFDWWMNDKLHRDAILSPQVTEVGVGYAYSSSSSYGGYFTVDFASP
jgi:uncharacterized protein YkwD